MLHMELMLRGEIKNFCRSGHIVYYTFEGAHGLKNES